MSGFVMVSMDAILPAEGRHLRHTLKAVYVALRSFSNGSYESVYPSYAQIAQRAGLKSTRTVYNAVRELEAAGLIYVEYKAVYGRVNRYHFSHLTQESNARGYALDSSVKKNHNHGKEESDSSLLMTIMPTTKNHLNKNHYPYPSDQEPPTHSPSPEDERFFESALEYLHHASLDYNSFTPNEAYAQKIDTTLKQQFPCIQPFDLYLFRGFYKKNVRDANGKPYPLPININPLLRHVERWIGSRDRELAALVASHGHDVTTMRPEDIYLKHLIIEQETRQEWTGE